MHHMARTPRTVNGGEDGASAAVWRCRWCGWHMDGCDCDDAGDREVTNWASPAVTFPLVMKAVNIEEFFRDVLSGMVISVGGLTESVTRHSGAALLEWTGALKTAGMKPTLARVGEGEAPIFGPFSRPAPSLYPLYFQKLISSPCSYNVAALFRLLDK